MKCSKCSKKAEYYVIENNKKVYLCKEHSREKLIKGIYSYIPKIDYVIK
jgi:hypothetical protein